MARKSNIEWTNATWNPVTGCTKVSQGCKNCYAERDWQRISAPRPRWNQYTDALQTRSNIYTGRDFTDVQCHQERLIEPWNWVTHKRIFVNSMSDLFHERIPFEFIASVFAIMGVTSRHIYQVLTKRPERMLEFFNWAHDEFEPDHFCADEKIFDHFPKHIPWESTARGRGYDTCGPRYPYTNVWLGVSCEDQETADARIPMLLQTPAAVRWVSAEPLLGPVNFARHLLSRLDWVVVGGESGPQARPFNIAWARQIIAQCRAANIPCFVKQLGANVHWDGMAGPDEHWPSRTGTTDTGTGVFRKFLADKKGGDPLEWPIDLRVREYPNDR